MIKWEIKFANQRTAISHLFARWFWNRWNLPFAFLWQQWENCGYAFAELANLSCFQKQIIGRCKSKIHQSQKKKNMGNLFFKKIFEHIDMWLTWYFLFYFVTLIFPFLFVPFIRFRSYLPASLYEHLIELFAFHNHFYIT